MLINKEIAAGYAGWWREMQRHLPRIEAEQIMTDAITF